MGRSKEWGRAILASNPDIRAAIAASVHSRFPVHDGTSEEILGVAQAKDLLDAYLRGERPDEGFYIR